MAPAGRRQHVPLIRLVFLSVTVHNEFIISLFDVFTDLIHFSFNPSELLEKRVVEGLQSV